MIHPSANREPNLFLAGFAKCGTTSLAKYLSAHPDVATPPVKELYAYVDEGPLCSYRDKIAEKTEPFHIAVKSYYLDATPFYFCQKQALDFARRSNDCKIIFITRHPIARLASSFRFFSEVYQEYPSTSFEEFASSLLSSNGAHRFSDKIHNPFFKYIYEQELSTGRYAEHIDRWVGELGNSRVIVLCMENLERDPRAVMSCVCTFLGLPTPIYDNYDFRPYMKSYSVRLKSLQRCIRRLGGPDFMRYERLSEYQTPAHFTKLRAARVVSDFVFRNFQRTQQEYQITAGLRARLLDHYRSTNENLVRNYGIDYTEENFS